MKIDDWLKESISALETANISTARLDCLVLLEDIFGKDRSLLLANKDLKISQKHLDALSEQIKQRSRHMPLAYIRGKTEFYKREFLLNKNVLEPRPESETMIELLKQPANRKQITENTAVLDLGTGCGAIAITTKLEFPKTRVIASDIDKACLELAQKNARLHKAKIELIHGDLMLPLAGEKIDIILANLPYVPDNFKLNEAAMNEPRIAIFGGSDGLDLYRRFFRQIDSYGFSTKYIFTEALPFQHEKLEKIAGKAGYKLQKTDDFIQLFKPIK